jgi:hypothetical protein
MPLTGHSVIVGSDPQAHVPVRADLGVAARHYELRSLPDGRHEVVALVPTAPVLINGQRVGNSELADGDVITAGALNLTYRADPRMVTMTALSKEPVEPESEVAGVNKWTVIIVAWILGTLACMLASGMSWMLWSGLIAGAGAGVGWMIGAGVKRAMRHPCLVAAGTGVLCLLAANLARHEQGMADYRAEQMAVMEAAASVSNDDLVPQRQEGYAFDPTAAADSVAAAPTAVVEPAAPAKPVAKPPPPVPEAFSIEGLAWLLLNGKVVTGYGLIAAMAWMVCGAMGGGENTGGRPLRERLEFEKPKPGAR